MTMHSSELKWAHERVIQSRKHVETAFEELDRKIESGKQAYDRALHQAQAPVRWAKSNPWWSVALFSVLGLWMGYRYRNRETTVQLSFDEVRDRSLLEADCI